MKKYLFYVAVVLLFLNILLIREVAAESDPVELKKNLENAINKEEWTYAATYSKELAVFHDTNQDYDQAVQYYRATADYWAKAGHADWGIVNLIRADHIDTEMDLLVERIYLSEEKVAKFEPPSGTYLGMFVAGKRENGRVNKVNDLYGKKHALYLTYTPWRKKYQDTNSYFPLSFAEKVRENGGAMQIGWEPSNGLDDVVDDDYVRQFAREAKATGIPVFLRFAGEMNGEWVPWSGNSEKYREKFRLIHDIMAEEAPNVAMVWSPNFLPRHNIEPYYPGDNVVDWVGFSLYTIPFSHGKEVPGGNPIDYLRPLYEKYSHKPIMLSEGAVSHYSYELDKDYSEWAAGQIGNMYGFLPRLFPKVKAITYFNLDKRTTNYDNQNNNYDMGDNQLVDITYKRIIASNWFLSDVRASSAGHKASKFERIENISKPTNKRNCFVYVKLPLGEQPYLVAAYQGNNKLAESYAQPWEMKIDFSKVREREPITVIAYDCNLKSLVKKEFMGRR
ncbi:MAG TPA: copper amine oxidase [Bacillales bacterium]|nr:copper amine oxidase [Bacillales bacterium]